MGTSRTVFFCYCCFFFLIGQIYAFYAFYASGIGIAGNRESGLLSILFSPLYLRLIPLQKSLICFASWVFLFFSPLGILI